MQGCLRIRSNIFYYRRRVPLKFIPKFFKADEILKSLRINADCRENKKLAIVAGQDWDLRVGVLLATPKIDTPKRSQPPCLNRSRHFLTSKLKTQNHKKKKQNYLTVVDCFFLFHRLNVAKTAISHAVMVGKMLIQAKAPLYFQANSEKFL